MTSVPHRTIPSASPPGPLGPPVATPRTGWRGLVGRLAPPLLFALALAGIAWGLSIVRSRQEFPGLPPPVRDALTPYGLANPGAIIVGGALALIGALAAGLAARRALPDPLAGRVLPWPRLRRDLWAGGALALGLAAQALLWIHLAGKQYTPGDIALFLGGLALLAFAVDRWDRPRRESTFHFTWADGAAALALGGLALAVNLTDLTRWTFAWIGDEGSFFGAARDVATRPGVPWNFFNLAFVYDAHPMLDTLYQGGVMAVAGTDVWGWRFSEVLLLAVSTVLMYPLGTALLGRVAAVAACVTLGSSHYLMAFARIAYNNLHVVFWGTLVLLLLALAWRTGRAVCVFGAGLALGFCLYTFQIAVVTWPLVALVLALIFFRRPTWGMLLAGLVLLAGWAVVVTPGLLATSPDLLIQNAINNSHREAAASDTLLVARVSLMQSLLLFWSDEIYASHYVGGALVDAVSGLLLVAGLGVCLFRLHKRAERLIFLWFAAGLALLSTSNYMPHPQLTRLLYLMPAAALLVGVAVGALDQLLRRNARLPPLLAGGVALAAIVAVPPLNLYQLLVVSPTHLGANDQIMRMKEVQQHPGRRVVEVGTKLFKDSEAGNALLMFGMYPSLRDQYQYVPVAEFNPAAVSTLTGTLPIYLVTRANIRALSTLVGTLPAPYQLATDYDPAGSDKVWLLTPDPGAGVALHPAGTPPPLNPVLVAEVRPDPARPLPPGQVPAGPGDVAVDSRGNFYVAGLGDDQVHKFDPGGQPLLAWGDPPAYATALGNPAALAVGPDDTVYVLDAARGWVWHFDPQGRSRGDPFGGLASGARGLAVAPTGDVLVADTANARLALYSPAGRGQGSIGKPGRAPGELTMPTDAVTGPGGDFVVLDAGNARIQHLAADGSPLQAWAAPAADPQVPMRLALDRWGRLFVTAPRTRQVLVYSTSGALLGTWTPPGTDLPGGIFVDAQDQLYLTFPQAGVVCKYRLSR